MKITRLKLKNYIGIKHGLGKDEIEIDFTKGKNKIVMFLGKNGSGKSTILGALNPFKQSTDNRSSIILPNKDGLKEIDIEHNGHKYEIKHITGLKTSQSFIKKDGVELNENGSVKNCEEIIKKELGITKEYSKIGKIGSNTKNFVDFTAADRKTFIGTFLDIDELTEKYKVVSTKKRGLDKEIKTVMNDLGRYQDLTVVEENIKTLTGTIDTLDKELKEKTKEIGTLDEKVKFADDELAKTDLNFAKEKYEEKESSYKKSNEIMSSLESSIDKNNARERLETLTTEINSLNNELIILKGQIDTKETVRVDYNNSKISSMNELSGIKNEEELNTIRTNLASDKKLLDACKENILENSISEFLHPKIKEGGRDNILKFTEKFKIFTDFLEKYFTELSDNTFVKSQLNIEYFLADDCEEKLVRQMALSRDAIQKKNDLLKEQEKELANIESHLYLADTLKKRPIDCGINVCPFIAEAIKWSNADQLAKEKENEIRQTKTDLEELNKSADKLESLKLIFDTFKEAYRQVQPRENYILTEFLKEKSLVSWFNGSLAEFQQKRFEFIENIETVLTLFNRFKELKAKVTSEEDLLNSAADTKLEEKYKKDIAEFEKKIASVQKDIDDLVNQKNAKEVLIKEKRDEFNIYDTYVKAYKQADSDRVGMSNYKSTIDKLESIVRDRDEANLKLSELTESCKTISKNLENARTQYNREFANRVQIKEYLDKKENLEKNFNPISTITDALSPTKGIQLVLIQTYLHETEAIANELLDTAYNGDFQIKFVSSEREFAIKVMDSKGNIKDDISLASQGEIALTTISISLALIEQAIGEYNILSLDEIDGPLDKDNRNNFINILEKQIKKLGIEQVFVISHNNAFDSCGMDLILLKDHGVDFANTQFMSNKTVIFNKDNI